jgi:long-chain acyl-CoA synthetase
MLSHTNMLSVAHAVLASIDVYRQDLFMSFLPLSHTLERTAGYYLPMMAGAMVAHARSVTQLADDLLVVKPTVLVAVPRIFERVYDRIHDRLQRQSPLARSLFHTAVRVGWRQFRWRQGQARWTPVLLLNPLLRRLVGNKVTARLGGNMRYAVSGGAPLSLRVAQTFIGLGLEILQGYGMTETSPVISVNLPGNNDPASVGEPLRGIEVRIDENDELMVRTPGAMLGYWNNHAATAELIEPDGWLHTGDQARIEAGRIYITGRIKDILVMSNGEKIPPADMEAAICYDTLIDQALVVGENRSCLSAILVLNPDRWFGFASDLGLDPYAHDSLDSEKLQRKLLMRVQAQLHDFPGYAKVRRLILTQEAWTVENGLMTPTLKLKRAQIMQQFERQIEALYSD